MTDKRQLASLFEGNSLAALANRPKRDEDAAPEADEDSSSAFGYLRGARDRALTLEFRHRNGDIDYFPYSFLAGWRFNPSAGLLVKFTADVVTLALIRGSNLDMAVNGGIVSLTNGLTRHRITWIGELDEDALKRAGEGEPTIDRIEVAEFESADEQRQWLVRMAPVFAREAPGG
ncbi:hypothetical protein [Zavarzinella formosa]|uniref:hypothetical protein n=1 Tax=Zavarzinella formosa TaxID=360055 RepID=UPI00036CC437|nr:hypothetical protein [Zavarzinella formosa]